METNNEFEKISTPFYIINEAELNKGIEEFKKALYKYWPGGIIGYSFKTNNLPWIINHMKEQKIFAEVVSSDEYLLAKELGYSPDKIIFNGPVKGKKEFLEALEYSGVVNIDSKRELVWISERKEKINSKIGLRVNFDLEKECPNETQCGNEDGRFGFSYETGEFQYALNYLQKNNIKISGLHLHCSSKTRSLNIYESIAKMAVKIVDEFDLKLNYIDVGGGFFGGMPNKPTFEEYFRIIKNEFSLSEKMKDVNLIVEPGMAIIGAPIDYVTTVVDVKKTPNNNFVLLDGSRIHIDPLMRKTRYFYTIEKKKRNMQIMKKQTLCGFTCMENDRFFQENNECEISVEDKVIFHKVGAYTMGLSPLFIQFFPAVYVRKMDGKILIAREKCDVKNFLNKEI